MSFRSFNLLLAAALFAGAGCAAPTAPSDPLADSAPPGTTRIVSVRPLPAADAAAPILAAVGTPGSAPTEKRTALYEFIVRDGAGRAVSVVQANDLQLRPGDRVTLSRGALTTLARSPGL